MKALTDGVIAGIIQHATRVVNLALPMADGIRTGAYLCVTDHHGNRLFIAAIGEVPDDKASRYCDLAQEKAERLARNPAHLLSWQTRNPETDQWGGAIYGETMIFSLSGLSPDLLDEAAMLYLAVEIGELSQAEAIAMSKISGSDKFYPLES